MKPAEEAGQAAARLDARLRAGAARLKLEAAIEGSMAIINGRTYREGDMVQGGDEFSFRLDQVRQRSVILVCEDRQFELEMSSPGI